MQNIYQTFEFSKIQDHLKEYARTALGHLYIEELEMYKDVDKLLEVQKDLLEMSSIITRFGIMPISNSANALYLIDLAKKTGLLTPRDLNLIAEDVLTSQKVATFINKIDLSYERIKAKVAKFYDLTSLEKEIHRVITNSLTISDNATPELKEIRKNIKKAESELNQKIATLSLTYSQYLNDDNATIRDGHFVLPVKTVEKSRVPGIVYDISDSGNTTFIEPLEIVQINNLLTSLKVQENDEIRKILKALTGLCLIQEDEIITNNKIIGELDFLSAKSLYASEIEGEVATYSKESLVDLIEARHPLIDKNKVVSNTYHIDSNKRLVVISGPNAGGKTVSLKTVGICVLMNQCGLAVPAKKATLSYFEHIYIDIGDNQSLSDNLSTFSAHMSHISEIVELVKGKDLVLLDELGTGTAPKEGEALAIAVSKHLEAKHALSMISSHFDALKEYAYLSNNIENSSMVFDEEKLEPTYKFRLGYPGHSYALDVARRYGLKEDVILTAKAFLENENTGDVNELLSILQSKVEENTRLEELLKKQEADYARRIKKLEVDEDNLSKRRENLLKDVEKEKKELIQKAKDDVKEVLSSLNTSGVKLHEVIELKHKLEELEENESLETFNEKIEVNDYISIPSLNIQGKVDRIKANKAHVLTVDGLSFDVDINKMIKIAAPKKIEKKNVNYDSRINTSVGLELNIIGLHVDEAKDKLMKYLDACQLKNLGTVRIIHGFGSGALRKMVHAYLDENHIKYRPGQEHEGAGGATVVIFHD